MPPFRSLNVGDHVGDDPKAVERNRVLLAARAGLHPQQLVWMDQVHSTDVAIVTAATPTLEATDGAVTATAGLGLTVMVADCVPILAHDDEAGVVGVAHAGRNGASAGIAAELLHRMVSVGAEVPKIRVVLGPAVCGGCYEVPPQMQADVAVALPGSAVPTTTGTTGLDLRLGLRRQFQAAGVAGVDVDNRCTAEDPGLFSFRRDGRTGRQVGVIWLTAD